MSLSPPPYSIVESLNYTEGAKQLGNYERTEDALCGITWALCHKPRVYDVVKGMVNIRLLQTDAAGDLPKLSIWFRIDDSAKRIELMAIEPVLGDDNG